MDSHINVLMSTPMMCEASPVTQATPSEMLVATVLKIE